MPVAEMRVDKQPSVAVTIQKEHSYFSGINLSFLTNGNQSDCSQCMYRHCSHTQRKLHYFALGTDPVVAAGGGQGSLETHLPLGAAVQVNAGGALGGSAPETLRCPLFHFHLEASVWLKSDSTRKAQSSEHRVSDPRFIQHRPVSMSVER